MSERLGEVHYYKVKKPTNMMGTVIAGLVLGVLAHEASSYIDRRRAIEAPVAIDEDADVRLTTEERVNLYGKQELFVCVVPGPDGQLRQIELNIGGPETPIEAARILEPDLEKAWVLLEAGIEEYNGLAQGPQAELSKTNQLGVVFDELQNPSTTQVWGVKAMTVEVFKEQNGL